MAYIREYAPGPDPFHVVELLETETMSKMGEEDSVFVSLFIQGTSTKNFYFIPSPQSAVRVLYLVHVLYPVRIFQSAFYT